MVIANFVLSSRSIRRISQVRLLLMVAGVLFKGVRYSQDFLFFKRRSDDLQPDRQPVIRQTARNGDCGHSRETRRRSQNIREVHL